MSRRPRDHQRRLGRTSASSPRCCRTWVSSTVCIACALNAEIGRHQRRHPCRPAGPGIALLARQAEHQGRGPGPVDQLALERLQPHLPFLRLQHLVGGARLQIGHAAGRHRRRQALVAQGLRDRVDGGLRDRAQRWLCRRRCIEGSVACARRASDPAASIEPSACSTSRPETRAFCTAPRETPACAAYSRSLMPWRCDVIDAHLGLEKAM